MPASRPAAHETVGGFLAAAAIALGAVAMVYRPVRVGVPAEVVALVAARMCGGGPAGRLAGFACAFCGVAWFVGMVVAVVTNNPIY